ncbi:hypothetical protein D1007_02262 [Hordeum vulgare]|nr:hypothetical protein D1007_02262 [Hordeum vulgare]
MVSISAAAKATSAAFTHKVPSPSLSLPQKEIAAAAPQQQQRASASSRRAWSWLYSDFYGAPIKDDGHDSDEEYERHHNIVGNVEDQVRHDDMDPDIVYQRACVDESSDEGPVNELDEDGFTEKETELYTKIIGRDHKVPLFCDVSLADKAIVDGGMSKTIEARMFSSSTHDAVSTSYLKKSLMFKHMLEFKMWLCEYAVKHYMPFIVVHSDYNKRYTMKCKGARQLPVTGIAEYTFYKLNEYFLKHSEEIDKWIGGSEKPSNEIYPKKIGRRKPEVTVLSTSSTIDASCSCGIDSSDTDAQLGG